MQYQDVDLTLINAEKAGEILTKDWVLLYLQHNFPDRRIESVTPYSDTIGSVNHSEGLENELKINGSMFFGKLQLDINPNGSSFAADNITIEIDSLLNTKVFTRHLNRIVEIQNYINEQTERIELFDRVKVVQTSTLYDTYLAFIGFKIDWR
ncbi:hypothetical protein DBR40_19985 [Pedobacter sp. KBW01]|uniref:hypothetical protein n=1 Tax=Pedobacter sp. KBW01 TaxID=2153364 RepID=UPI000F59F8BF|nr:hypothetical protein [Pedobacter sp. KBW01]RQO68524.1 hypothetical protein DBR40_19985 [Pedobacter sp. KBW01]